MKRKASIKTKSLGRRSPTLQELRVPRESYPARRRTPYLAGLRTPQEQSSGVPVFVRIRRRRDRFPTAVGLLPRRNPPSPQLIKNEKRFRENLQRSIMQLEHKDQERRMCRQRHERRKALFKHGIAGKNKRKSPGKNNTYLRTNESEKSCKRN